MIVKTYDRGDSIVAIKGNKQKIYKKEYLTKCWLTMSNDSFFDMFGFNWVPPLELQEKVRQRLPRREV